MTGRKRALFPSLFLLLTFWILCTASLFVYANPASTSPTATSPSQKSASTTSTTTPPTASTTSPASPTASPDGTNTPSSSPAVPADVTPASKASSAVPAQTKPASKASPAASTPVSSALNTSFFLVSSVPSSSGIVLPDAGSVGEIDPLASALENRASSKKMNLYGMLAWACIVLGAIVVVIVVLSNRRPGAGAGRSRYSRPKHGRKHRLLGDKYYRNIHKY